MLNTRGLLVLILLASGATIVSCTPSLAYGRSPAGAVVRSISKNLDKATTSGKPRDVVVRRMRYPQAARHIEEAQRNGQPTVLHVERNAAASRRTQAIGTVNRNPKPQPGYERDEYPPAFAREGGSGASVRFIDPRDNRGAGASVRAQTSDLPNGAKIRVLVQ